MPTYEQRLKTMAKVAIDMDDWRMVRNIVGVLDMDSPVDVVRCCLMDLQELCHFWDYNTAWLDVLAAIPDAEWEVETILNRESI